MGTADMEGGNNGGVSGASPPWNLSERRNGKEISVNPYPHGAAVCRKCQNKILLFR